MLGSLDNEDHPTHCNMANSDIPFNVTHESLLACEEIRSAEVGCATSRLLEFCHCRIVLSNQKYLIYPI